MSPIIGPGIVGSARFKTDRPDQVKKLPPSIRKLANYEYRNSKSSLLASPMGLVTPTWSPTGVEKTGEKKAIYRTRKSCRIALKGSEKRLFVPEARFVVDLVSDDVPKEVVDLTSADADSTQVIDLTSDTSHPVIDLTGEVEATNNPGSKLSNPDEIFSKQCHVTAYDRSNLDNRNVLVPYDELISFLDSNFLCEKCKGNSGIVYERQTCGIATSINMVCSCGKNASIKARMRTTADHYEK
jgi:hypothetical protein